MKVITGAKLTGIGERDISYEKDGKTEALGEFDSVVIAVGAAPGRLSYKSARRLRK